MQLSNRNYKNVGAILTHAREPKVRDRDVCLPIRDETGTYMGLETVSRPHPCKTELKIKRL